ncbi:MAG TPA: chromate transporter [Oscillospiraceae bacterium]|nr:chromate transporter [Oscillospiraceae bacterium]
MIYLTLFFTFFKIGAFTFGGGYAMIPMIQSEVLARGWMDAQALVDFIAVSESTPGPFAVNIATYVGSVTAGVPGSACATLGVVLPSFLVILVVARCFAAFRKSRFVTGCMAGLRPAVVGLIGAAAVSVGRTVFFPDGFFPGAAAGTAFLASAAIFLMMLLLGRRKLHPIFVILLAAALGLAAGYAGLLPA